MRQSWPRYSAAARIESSSELERVLHEEINRLPDCYRVPIVLCDLEALPARRRRGGWAARLERSRAGVFGDASGCETG